MNVLSTANIIFLIVIVNALIAGGSTIYVLYNYIDQNAQSIEHNNHRIDILINQTKHLSDEIAQLKGR